jgi:hypothetical protein
MTAEDFLNQYDPSNKRSVSQEPASSTTSFLDQYDPSINKNIEPESSGFLRQAADIPIQFAKGVGSAVRGYTDLFGADNEVSKSIAGYEDYMDSILSAESKKDSKRVSELLQKAKDGGFLDKVAAGFEAFASAPAEMTANTLGYMVPQLVFGVAGKAAQLSKAAQVGLTIGTGFAQGVGMGKGNIYQGTKDYLREQGVPEDQIEPIASRAQAYNGKNLDQLLLSGGLNALAASTGAEAILTRVLSKQGKDVGEDIIKGILKGIGTESPIEGVQSAQEAIAPNIALQREGFNVPTFQGAIESATTGIVAGGVVGGAAGAIEAASPEQKALTDIEKEANRRMRDLESDNPAAQALSTEITRLERGIDNKRQDLDALESTSPEASSLRLDIAADQKKLATLKTEAAKFGLSETITTIEEQQAALAKTITAPAEPTVKQSLTVQPTQAAPVEQVVTPPVEVAPAPKVKGDFTPPQNWEETYKAAVEGSLPEKSFYSMYPDEFLLTVSQSTDDNATLNSVLDKIDPEKSKNKKGEYVVWEIATRPNISSEVKARAENLFKQIAPEKNIIQPVQFENISEEQQISDIKNKGIEATHYSKAPMELKKEADLSESFDNVFDNGFYAMEPSDELYWSYIYKLGNYKNKIKVNPKNPILITPETLRKYGYDAIKQRIDNKDYDAIIVRGWREDQYQKITDLAEKNLQKNIPQGKATKEQRNAELDKASLKLLNVSWDDYSKLSDSNWNQNQIFIPTNLAPEIISTTPAVSETITKPKIGQKGGVLIPTKEDFIQAGQNIYEAGMEFGAWAKQMIQRFGDAVREFLGEVWQAVSGAPAKLNELMGYLPKKGETGAVNVGKGKIGEKAKSVEKPAQPAPEQPTPTPEKPTEPVTETPSAARKKIMGEEIGELKDTPKNIIAKTKALLRERVFDPTKVTEQNTIEAFRALGKLTGNKQERRDFADELNDIAAIVEDTGAASEVSMGAALFVNDLFEYAVRLAAEGQKMMLGIMMTNINRLPTGTEGRSDAGRALRAAREMKDTFLTMAQAEQDAFINYAAEFVYGPNPTKEQVDSIQIGYDAVEKVEEPTAEELTDELNEVGKKTGTDLVAKIEDEIAQATSTAKDPIVAAMLALQKLGGGTIETKYLPYSKRASSRFEGVKKILKEGLSNYRQKMVEGAATGLETGFWKTLSNEENKPGSLGELDAAQNRELGSIVKSMLISLGLKGTPPNTKMSIYEQVASILGEKPLSQDKIKLADENIRAEIKRKREKELDDTEDSDEQDAINVKYDGIENAWDKAMAQQLDMPISESTLRRLIFNELKEENTSIVKLVKMMDENPNDAISKQDGLINAIIEKISKIKFVYPSSADYTLLKENLENQLQGLIQERLLKEAAAKAKAKIAKEAKGSVDLQAEKAENEAQKQIDEFAKIQSDTISWFVEAKPAKQKVESVLKTIRKAIRDALKLDAGEANDFVQKWKPAFIEKLVKLGVKDSSASILASVVGRQIEVNSMSKKIELQQNEVDSQMQKIQNQAKSEIGKLAKIQSDTPSFEVKLPSEAKMNPVRDAVKNALKLNLNKMFDPKQSGEIISNFKKSFVKELKGLGVEETAADILADVVGRQIEINSLNNQLKSIDRAIEKGSISEIVKAIKDTPLEEQQNPNWRYEVMRDYLRRAGLNVAQSERIAKLMDISLQKRFTMAQEQAFTDAISKTAPWKAGDTRSRRAFQKVLQALRAGALDPARNVLSDMAALNGWTGFTPEQYKVLLKNDAILSNPESADATKAEAHKAIQDVISKAKLPIRARDVIGQYYDAQALSGIPTLTVNAFSPIAFAMRNAIVEIGSGTLKGNPKAITNAATALVDSIKSWANTVAFSFKNNVTVYSNVDYIVNDDNLLRLYRKGVDQFTKSKNPKERADGVKNMMVGMMDYVRRMLNALDYGAIASLQNQNISKYSMAVMKRQGMSTKEGNEMFAVMMKAKNDFYLEQIAIGTDKNKASILADEFYISSWNNALTKAGVEKSDIKQAMDAAINDALSSVGRNRQSLDSLKDESTKLKDAGVASMPALWLLESMASASNQTESQILKLFSRIIYGYAIVPARVIRETAWFSPYGFVRFGYDWLAKKMNKTSPYAQSLGTDVQYSQRLNEAIAGTVALIALASLRAGSTDEPEEDEFKIVFTGNGPKRSDDPQFYDSWYKAGNKPNTMSVYFGKSKFDLNMMRGFEAFTWPAMTLGALDDLEIRKKQKRDAKTGTQLEDASIVAGFVFDAALRRGPYAFTTKSLFGTYGDIGVEGVAKGLTFPAKTLIPVLGTSLASNISNFINDPIDRRTLDGAVWSNIPFIGPAVAPKSLNAFGEPALSTDFASKMFKLGVPIVYDIPTDRESIMLHELVLSKGGGPSIPTRNQLAQRLDRDPTNKEYEMFVKEYGAVLTKSMKKNYEKLSAMKPEAYSKVVERIGNRARDIAENKVRVATKKP